jgi:hypothetical protein
MGAGEAKAPASQTDYGVWAGVNFGVTYEQVPG